MFSSNDWLLLRFLERGVGFAFGSIWGQVSSYINLGNDAEGRGRQSWTFTLRQGPVNQLVGKGTVAVDFGASGQGYVHLSTLYSAQGPWIQIGTWTGANPYTPGNRQIKTQIGRLSNISDTILNPAGYGLYSENAYLKGIVSAANDVVRLDDSGARIKGQPADYTSLYAYEFQNNAGDEVGGLYFRYTDLGSTDNVTVSVRAIGNDTVRPFAALLADADSATGGWVIHSFLFKPTTS